MPPHSPRFSDGAGINRLFYDVLGDPHALLARRRHAKVCPQQVDVVRSARVRCISFHPQQSLLRILNRLLLSIDVFVGDRRKRHIVFLRVDVCSVF